MLKSRANLVIVIPDANVDSVKFKQPAAKKVTFPPLEFT